MNIRPVKTEEDYDAALTRIVGAYEDEHHPVPPPSPIEAIRFVMEQKGLKNSDLIPYLGSRPRVSEILSGKRRLTLKMIRSLHSGLGIPAEILIRDSSTASSAMF